MKQSTELTKFYRAYAKWLDSGAPHWQPFARSAGLCVNLENYCNGDEDVYSGLWEEMRLQFSEAGLHTGYPFDNKKTHFKDVTNKLMHLNQKRIDWVRSHANYQSEELTAFYREILAWIEAGQPDHRNFRAYTGLCTNLIFSPYDHHAVGVEMSEQFSFAGLNKQFPFNGDVTSYRLEGEAYSTYQNPQRLAWIRKHAKI